ncbi:probable membrane-associated kinase regulator 4 [Mangifera indica]|uniref:probable membrane-associated kinase regulator 4 n=1 Tax=Mangifera indica TaxID=29780 RepID=UPI001CF93D4C|nr:probable membrane-associated kinase regulator 4 [Mangifera indica]
MAKNIASCNHVEDDYIDIEVSSSPKFLCYTINSPPQSSEFEFQMCSVSHDRESATSPADELFYKGKLLPLHLPPRLLMVQKLTTSEKKTKDSLEENCLIPFVTTSSTTAPDTSTPVEFCNVSPSESCRVSTDMNRDEYFFEWSTEMSGFIDGGQSKKSWTRKLKLIKKSSLGQKLKASRAYLMSLFSKSGCSDEFSAKAACDVEPENISKRNTCLSKSQFGKIVNDRYKISTAFSKNIRREMVENGANIHRRSFSGAIQRHSTMKCLSSSTSSSSSGSSSSSSFSFSSIRFYDLQLLKRSSSTNSEIENSIEGAIAHCKQSQQLFTSRKTTNEAGFCSLSTSRISVCGDRERPEVCTCSI